MSGTIQSDDPRRVEAGEDMEAGTELFAKYDLI